LLSCSGESEHEQTLAQAALIDGKVSGGYLSLTLQFFGGRICCCPKTENSVLISQISHGYGIYINIDTKKILKKFPVWFIVSCGTQAQRCSGFYCLLQIE
jgi:hypothetical protein